MRSRFLTAIANFVGDVGRAQAATSAYERLAAMSDERLAALGISRENVAAAAFEQAFGARR